jgi:hypothetical protein
VPVPHTPNPVVGANPATGTYALTAAAHL